MNLKKAKEILNSDGELSVDEILEAQMIVQSVENQKSIPNKKNSRRAFDSWKLRKREDFQFRKDLKTRWDRKNP